MNSHQFARLPQHDGANGCLSPLHDNLSRRGLEGFRRASLRPYIQLIPPEGQFRNPELSRSRETDEVRGFDNDHDSTHLGMDVAEDVTNSCALEFDAFGVCSFVETKVESSPVELREHVVKEVIQIGKIDRRTHLNCQ